MRNSNIFVFCVVLPFIVFVSWGLQSIWSMDNANRNDFNIVDSIYKECVYTSILPNGIDPSSIKDTDTAKIIDSDNYVTKIILEAENVFGVKVSSTVTCISNYDETEREIEVIEYEIK